MAKPQLENGHTQIANEILENLARTSLSPSQWKVILVIIRKTYGFHKKVDYIANSQIVEATGLCKAVVSRCLKELEGKQLIIRNHKHIGFQKDWEKWQGLAESSTSDTKLTKQSTSESCINRQPKLAISSTELHKSSTKVSSCAVTQKIKDNKQKILYKRKGKFLNVLLTDEEYQKLVDLWGKAGTDERIETLSIGIASKGYKYKNHYATILAWDRRDQKAMITRKSDSSKYTASGKASHKCCPTCDYKARTAEIYCPQCEDKGKESLLQTDYQAGKYGHMVQS